ncbi:hypothetical protein CFC21_085988 [Triticum aestivum]|uniref:Uncharacterized protein n=3 Tax=Triticum TaxID=4564 RepID=A0A9R0YE40_TRITD|nr:uncharacterized protein LOC123135441 [Triticum aestivum]XP_044410451.1 uncharacterized protein LOC123135441 [Triticum aestivum]XP_044410452.1 uncharacterized protein LOC123135441 [Triticum aestivum]XP_044410453.1 uncharacterized protein LOC123135441 [Triticum aestivum]VAI52784.1 unnamed protein product [Triticum turgidum subsp. durum]KAF7082108.1 hypothetical protein CFC21_085988 [Triticum aestivum]
MLRLRTCVLDHLISSPATSPVSSLHRLVSAAALAVSPNPSFAVEEYLVSTCGLTRSQALKASAKLSHLKSPANPDAVLALLAGLGLSTTDIAALVARDPLLLCAQVEKTLAPNVAGLTGLGLSRSEVARLASIGPERFRSRSIVSKLHYYLPLFGSSEYLLRALKRNFYLLSADLDDVVKPNVAYLQECGLGACDIAKLCSRQPWIVTANLERVQAMVECAENIGVPRASGMFRHALHAVAFLSEDKIAARVNYLKNTFSWTDAEVGMAVSKAPTVLARSKESLQRRSEFLISEVGLEPVYIAQRSEIIGHNLEGRLRPRYYAVKFLKENGLLKRDPNYSTVFKISEKAFRKKFIFPHKEAAPHLTEDYDAACKGDVPTNFRFT